MVGVGSEAAVGGGRVSATVGGLSAPDPEGLDVQALLLAEMVRVLENLMRLRFVAALLLGGFAVAFAATGVETWRVVLLAGATAVLGGMAFYDVRTFRRRPLTVGRQTYLMAGVLVIHSTMVLITGGIRSPFIVLLLVLVVVAGLSIGRVANLLVLLLPALGLIWAVTVADALGSGLSHFEWLGVAGPVGVVPGAHAWFFAAVLTLSMLLGSLIALAHRKALDKAIRRSALASHETLLTLAERNRETQELSGTLAHELKNPLASIQGLAGLLVRKLPEGSREAEQMAVLLGEARRMAGILDEFLNFSRPVGGLAVRSVDPAALLADVATLHEALAGLRGVDLRLDTAATTPLRGDPRKLKQVLVNLLQNALEASPRGTTVTLRARPEPDPRGVRFEVEDQGPGIAPELRERLFRPGATTKPAGSGLGLVIARSIARQHGGSLELLDRPDGGCIARCIVPAAPPDDPGGAP